MAVYFLNQGIILEQAVAVLIHEYLDVIDVDGVYRNFHVDVTNAHPFASLYLHNHMKAADSFPAIVVSTQADRKTGDLMQLAADVDQVGLRAIDIENLTRNTYETEFTDMAGEKHTASEKIPGLCAVTSQKVKDELLKIAEERGAIPAYDIKVRRTDTVAVDIWADNEQVKNELYEQLRLFILGGLPHVLSDMYRNFDISIFDHSVSGQRGGNYNMDFDVSLSGAMLTFDANYCIRQVIIDTDTTEIKEIETEVKDYVKEN